MKQVIVKSLIIALIVFGIVQGLLIYSDAANPQLHETLVRYNSGIYVITFAIVYTIALKIKRSHRKA